MASIFLITAFRGRRMFRRSRGVLQKHRNLFVVIKACDGELAKLHLLTHLVSLQHCIIDQASGFVRLD
jgi:DNA-binding FadR family transcriptional regulator